MLSDQVTKECIQSAKSYKEAQSSVDKDTTVSLTITVLTISSLGFGRDAASSPTSYTLIRTLSPMQRLSRTMQACILSPHCFIEQARSSGPYPVDLRPSAISSLFEGAVQSLHPSDYEGLEPRLGLEGCRHHGRSHGQL